MGNCFSSPEAKQQITNVEAQAKAKGTQALQNLEAKLQGTGTTGQATAVQPTPGANAAAPATGGASGMEAQIENKVEQAAKAEEPKLVQAAEKDLTSAGGAGTAPTATPAAT